MRSLPSHGSPLPESLGPLPVSGGLSALALLGTLPGSLGGGPLFPGSHADTFALLIIRPIGHALVSVRTLPHDFLLAIPEGDGLLGGRLLETRSVLLDLLFRESVEEFLGTENFFSLFLFEEMALFPLPIRIPVRWTSESGPQDSSS